VPDVTDKGSLKGAARQDQGIPHQPGMQLYGSIKSLIASAEINYSEINNSEPGLYCCKVARTGITKVQGLAIQAPFQIKVTLSALPLG
jgi:hypothetical protein